MFLFFLQLKAKKLKHRKYNSKKKNRKLGIKFIEIK